MNVMTAITQLFRKPQHECDPLELLDDLTGMYETLDKTHRRIGDAENELVNIAASDLSPAEKVIRTAQVQQELASYREIATVAAASIEEMEAAF